MTQQGWVPLASLSPSTPRKKRVQLGSSPRTSSSNNGRESIPLGDRRQDVYTKIREQLQAGEYAIVEGIIKMAMKSGQGNAVICRLTAERDYRFSTGKPGNMSPAARGARTALERESVEFHGSGAFWVLLDPWKGLTDWLKHEQGLVWDLSFVVVGIDRHQGTPMEASCADVLVSWPPYTTSETGRVHGALMQFWENMCIRKTVQISDGANRWKHLFKNALAAGQPAAIIQTLFDGPDFSLVDGASLVTHEASLICAHGARVWLSNARLPDNAIDEGAYWVLAPRYTQMVEWIANQNLNWYLAFDVEIDPTNKKTVQRAQADRIRDVFSAHMDTNSKMIQLDDAERFFLAAAALDPLPMKYRLSKWAYLVLTDYPIKRLGMIHTTY